MRLINTKSKITLINIMIWFFLVLAITGWIYTAITLIILREDASGLIALVSLLCIGICILDLLKRKLK